MAIGQYQGASTGTRPGGGTSYATPHRTTPLTPNPPTPIGGMARRPAGMNATLGAVRPDRVQGGVPGSGGMQPRTRVLRPLVAENPAMERMARPPGGVFPGTASAYAPRQPQPLGQFAPTPGTAGPGFAPQTAVSAAQQWIRNNPDAWAQRQQQLRSLAQSNDPRFQQWAQQHPEWARLAMMDKPRPSGPMLPGKPGNNGPMLPRPNPPSGPIYGGSTPGGGYDGSGINPGGDFYTKPMPVRGLPQLPVNGGPTMGINPRVDPTTGETVYW